MTTHAEQMAALRVALVKDARKEFDRCWAHATPTDCVIETEFTLDADALAERYPAVASVECLHAAHATAVGLWVTMLNERLPGGGTRRNLLRSIDFAVLEHERHMSVLVRWTRRPVGVTDLPKGTDDA